MLKKEVMIESLIFLKISKISIEKFKQNCDELVPFLINEIESNLLLLNEIKCLNPEVIEELKKEDKFTVFIKGIKVLYQIVFNMHTCLNLIGNVDTHFAIDIEEYWQQTNQGLNSMKKITKILDSNIGLSQSHFAPQIMNERFFSNEAIIDEGFLSIQRDKYSNMCSLCWTYISNSDSKDKENLYVPERWIEFCNINEEQQTYHNYCINLWINKISRNPN